MSIRVASHLLHPHAHSGAAGRLELFLPAVQVFCWTLKDAPEPAPPSASAAREEALREDWRRSAAIKLQAAERGRAARQLAELAADEAMIAEATATMEASDAERADSAAARSSLFSAASMSMPEAVRALLTSDFLPDSNRWESRIEQLALLKAFEHRQTPPRRLAAATG